MHKLKVYLDTSVISHLHQLDAPEKMTETHLFWEDLKQGKYDICVGQITLLEITDCSEPKRSLLDKHLLEIEYTLVSLEAEIRTLADKIIEQGILTRKSYNDCLHIASAVVAGCDLIASWNFKHIVNIKTINGVRAINMLNGYRPIEIYAPATLLERGDLDD